MSTDAASVAAPSAQEQHDDATDQIECAKQPQPAFLHSPPDSNNAEKSEASDSELSDLEDEPVLDDAPTLPTAPEAHDDIGEVLPDHWSGSVPVFSPTMDQFKDFKRFMEKVDSYGMKSGIIKIIPPKEWKDAQPPLDELVKQVRVREPIKQDIMGSNGTYRQVNILHGRSYNVPQWRQLCEQSEHQPPARRGERRANATKPRSLRARPAASKASNSTAPKTRGRGRPPKNKSKQKPNEEDEGRPMTPVSPRIEAQEDRDEIMDSVEKDPGTEVDDLGCQPSVGRMGGVRLAKPKTQSISARRKYSRREGSAAIDEAAFKDFDYQMDISDYTPERCEELERVYWKTLTYAPPLYGADLMGTLFDDRTEIWNLNRLPNLLDVLGTKVPGVNTAYLYLGMWKATFAWHLEDVDLYSINYLHFGAPKQWYSISQADARRFEAAMKSIWPADAKACDQFLRHKGFLISPQHLLQNYGIRVNKCVSYPGEFVVTYPYGYHSGYNLGYNCAEAVNFALDSWLEMGKIAKKCECAQAQDSVWVDVYEIERKMRGEETEYEETEDEDDEDEDDDDPSGLPTPPASHGVKFKDANRKRKRGSGDRDTKAKVKKIKLRLKVKAEPPCCMCPNDIPGMEILPTDDGRRAHRLCALYIPETYIDMVDGKEVISNIASISKDRLELKCLFCRSKRGACFQCSQKKCARAYHATCAAAAGVFTEDQDVPVFGEDGTEYKEQAFDFSCRFHRAKRDKKLDSDALEGDSRIQAAAEALRKGDVCQLQYYRGDIFAGMVVENRTDERMLLIDALPNGDRIEVEWKWLLLPHPSDYHLPKASANAIPLPASRKAKDQLNAKRHQDDKPRKDDVFVEGFSWAEFNTLEVTNKEQAKVNFTKDDQIWHYLGKTSTDARAQYTEDPSKPRYNPKGNYLDTIPKPPKPLPAPRPVYRQQAYGPVGSYTYPNTGAGPWAPAKFEKSYVYKPRKPMESNANMPGMYHPQSFMPGLSGTSSLLPTPQHYHHHQGLQTSLLPLGQIFGPATGMNQVPHAQALHPSIYASGGAQPIPNMTSTLPVGPRAPTSFQAPQHYSKPTWQVHSSVYQKYPFFQVNHNRDSSKYRTPYTPWGGFTNGYQGNLRAHLMANQNDLSRRSSIDSMTPGSGKAQESPSVNPPLPSRGVLAAPLATPQPLVTGASSTQNMISMSPPSLLGTPNHQYHPAIKEQYRILAQRGSETQPAPQQASKSKPTLAPKSYKIPPKQSPVPLPANFLAAMISSPSTPASAAKPPPLKPAGHPAIQHANNTDTKFTEPTASRDPPTTTGINPEQPVKISTTPVPLPRFTVQIQQNEAHGIMPGAERISVLPNSPRVKEESPEIDPTAGATGRGEPSMIQDAAATTATSEKSGDAAQDVARYSGGTSDIPKEGLILDGTSTTATVPAVPADQQAEAGTSIQPLSVQPMSQHQPEGFPDVPGCESMEFVERMMENLRRASQRWDVG